MTTKSNLSILALTAALGTGCASAPPSVQGLGTALGGVGNAVADVGRAGIAAVRAAAAPASAASSPAPAKEEKKPAGVKWDNTAFAEKLTGQSDAARTAARAAAAATWFSPNNEYVSVTVAPKDAKSKVTPSVSFGQISAEACNRTAGGLFSQGLAAGGNVLSGTLATAAGGSGAGAQVARQSGVVKPTTAAPSVTALTGAYAGLTDAQKTECVAVIKTVKGLAEAEGQKLSKDFSQKNKGVPFEITYSGTKGVDVILGLTIPKRAPGEK